MSTLAVVSLNLTTTEANSPSIILTMLLGFCLSLIAFTTTLGNMIVLMAFYCDKKLRTINDYFILNMAVADFLVGFICIPFYIPYSITRVWTFGGFFCKIWVTIDDVATMASVINIVAISVNRYWSIAYPLPYRKYVRQHFVYLVMGGIWCFSFINFAPGIWLYSLFNDELTNSTDVNSNSCAGDYNNSFVYMLIAQFNYLIWPFIVVCILNMLLMLNIWKRSRKMSHCTMFNQEMKVKEDYRFSSPLGTSKELDDDQQRLSILSRQKQSSMERCPSIIMEENENHATTNPLPSSQQETKHRRSSNISSPKVCHGNRNSPRDTSPMLYVNRRSTSLVISSARNYPSDSYVEYELNSQNELPRPIALREINLPIRSTTKCQQMRKHRSRIVRDRKAARSLFILVIVFLIFLFPYVICAIATTAGATISSLVFEISFWLLWFNSTCNPFLYPFIQMKYRRAYAKLFQSCTKCFTCSRSNRLI